MESASRCVLMGTLLGALGWLVSCGEPAPRPDAELLKALTVLTPQAAKGLASSRRGMLALDGLTEVTPEAARELAHYDMAISLGGIGALPVPVARELAMHSGHLYLDGVSELSSDLAAALGAHRGFLSLNGVGEISFGAAQALARGDCMQVSLSSLSVQPPMDAILDTHRGKIQVAGDTFGQLSDCCLPRSALRDMAPPLEQVRRDLDDLRRALEQEDTIPSVAALSSAKRRLGELRDTVQRLAARLPAVDVSACAGSPTVTIWRGSIRAGLVASSALVDACEELVLAAGWRREVLDVLAEADVALTGFHRLDEALRAELDAGRVARVRDLLDELRAASAQVLGLKARLVQIAEMLKARRVPEAPNRAAQSAQLLKVSLAVMERLGSVQRGTVATRLILQARDALLGRFAAGNLEEVADTAQGLAEWIRASGFDASDASLVIEIEGLPRRCQIHIVLRRLHISVTGTAVNHGDGSKSVAVVNGRPHRVGDLLGPKGEIEIVEIRREEVVFRFMGELFVRMRQPDR